MIILPKNFTPQETVQTEHFTLEVLGPKHNELDYAAWTGSRANLKDALGPQNPWPEEHMTLSDNMDDLKQHRQEFDQREAFAYTILTPKEDQCIGCLYIRPTRSPNHDCYVDLWLIDSHRTMRGHVSEWVDQWLKTTWGFQHIAYPGHNISWSSFYRLNSPKRGKGNHPN